MVVPFVTSLLVGKAAQWAAALWCLRQGSRSVANYAIEFRILVAESGWHEIALQGAFIPGLSEEIKDELAARDETDSL